MHMNHNVLIYVESRYQVSRKRMKQMVTRTLEENNIKSSVEISLAIIGDRKMRVLNKKYRDKEGTTNILSFPLAEGKATVVPTDKMRLGDIVISYPQIIKEAARDDMLVDDKVDELIQHGLLHLLGMHHE